MTREAIPWPKAGEVYHCVHDGRRYRVLGPIRHAHSHQELIAYRDLTTGELWCCTISDFVGNVTFIRDGKECVVPRFALVEPPAAAPAAEKPAGVLSQSVHG